MDVSTISLTSVNSSNIAKMGYDPTRKILVIEFHSGSKYAYKDVPEEVYDNLVHAESVGGTFHRDVKTKYDYERV